MIEKEKDIPWQSWWFAYKECKYHNCCYVLSYIIYIYMSFCVYDIFCSVVSQNILLCDNFVYISSHLFVCDVCGTW